MNNSIIELVEYITRQFVSEPEKLKITATQNENTVTIVINAADKDMGKIIGKQGRIAKAIRTIVKSASSKEKLNYFVQIRDSVTEEDEQDLVKEA